MTSKKLQKMYSEYWNKVESSVLDDMNRVFKTKENDNSNFAANRAAIAHNAAFVATNEHHKICENDQVKKVDAKNNQ